MSRILDNILAALDDQKIDRSVVSVEPDDGAAAFDLVMSDVHTFTLEIEGYPADSVRFIMEDAEYLEDVAECVEIALYLEFPDVACNGDPGLKYTITRYVTAMYDEAPTQVSKYTGMTGYGLSPLASVPSLVSDGK